MTHFFSKEKFQKLSLRQQHKKAAELLRLFYEQFVKTKEPNSIHLHHYEILSEFLELPKLLISLESLSNRYHYHLERADLFLKEHRLLPHVRSHDTLSNSPFLPIDIYLDNIRSAHNIGSILRTTEALRLGSLYFSPTMAQPDCKKVKDTAMGTCDKVICKKIDRLNTLKRPFIALETAEGATSIYDYLFPQSFSLFLGNEEYGLSSYCLKQADIILHIPLYGFKNSLNVACAFSIIAGEIRRQLI